MITCGGLVNAWLNEMRAKQPACGLLPVLMFIVPVVSEPLTEAEPPLPSTDEVIDRLGDGPVKLMWFGISSEALPLKISRLAVICDAFMAPLKFELPATVRFRKLVSP